MSIITIELSGAQYKALAFVAVDPVEWVQTLVSSRAAAAIDELYALEVERMRADNTITTIPTDKASVVLASAMPSAYEQNETRLREMAPAPPPAAAAVTMRQARLALLANGLLDKVDAGVAGLSRAAQVEWEYSEVIRRDNALVIQLTGFLGLAEADMDALFAFAAGL